MSVGPGRFQTIPEALAYWAAASPDAVALLTPGQEPATYRELHAAVRRLAAALRARGLDRQDGIALLFPEGPDFAISLLAALSVGIAVPLAWPNPLAEYRRILANPRVKAIVASAAIPLPDAKRTELGLPVITLARSPGASIADFNVEGTPLGDPATERVAKADEIAIILRSSGTTGRPKLAPRTHQSIASTCHALSAARGVGPDDRCFSPARVAYSQGITALTLPIFSGGSQISLPGLELDMLPSWLKVYPPTYLSTTPAFLRTLDAEGGRLRDALRRAPLRCIHSTASPLPADELRQLEEALGCPILNGYGMSEAAGIAGERYPALHRVPGAVGQPWCDIQFVDERGDPVGQYESGEIAVRGPRVFPGYLDDPEANAAAFLPGGWFRTGDLGILDEFGYLHLTGRRDEIINRGGEKIVPHEVDEALVNHPAVAEAAVFRVADARLGEDIVAAVVLAPGQTASARHLRAWMLDRLSPYKAPRRIWFVDRLPRTPTGKVQRGELVRRWSEDRG
jgi:acyl-CoA synthetase (AMP-forming)/AMP-acid ligase II